MTTTPKPAPTEQRIQIYSIGPHYRRCQIWAASLDGELIGRSTLTPDKDLYRERRYEIIAAWLVKNGFAKPSYVKGKRA